MDKDMIMTLEQRMGHLEQLVRDLTARVNKLEYANMRYGGPGFTPGTLPQWPIPGLPVTCDADQILNMEIKR